MNIRFPKTQNCIPSFCEELITSFITPSILSLYRKGFGRVHGRIGMPKIAIPLNDDSFLRQQDIDNKFASNNLLLKKLNLKAAQEFGSSTFQARCSIGTVMQPDRRDAFEVLEIFTVIATAMRAIFDVGSSTPPCRDIKRFLACRAAQDLSCPQAFQAPYPLCLTASRCLLPSVRTSRRAKTYTAFASRLKRSHAIVARKGNTCLACRINGRPWKKAFATLITAARGRWLVFAVFTFPLICTQQGTETLGRTSELETFFTKNTKAKSFRSTHKIPIPWSMALCN